MSECNIICINCGKQGHKLRECKNPVTSYGIICINFLDKDISYYIDIYNKSKYTNICSVDKYSNFINQIVNELKILMVCRKNTIGYFEFIRGNYKLENKNYIKKLFECMTVNEIQLLSNNKFNFDFLWKKLWGMDIIKVDTSYIDNEYHKSKIKFEQFNILYDIDLEFASNSEFEWETPEWGFPKGRRNMNESDLECACREFEEETGLTSAEYKILDIKPLYENFTGSDGRPYRHIYYIAQSSNLKISIRNDFQLLEISDIKWVKYYEGMNLIRNYNKEKKKLLRLFFNIIKNIIHTGISFLAPIPTITSPTVAPLAATPLAATPLTTPLVTSAATTSATESTTQPVIQTDISISKEFHVKII